MRLIGRIVFWCSWPLLWFVMPLTRRVRVAILHDNKVLVVKNLIGPNKWDLPGGGIKSGETAEVAARRELIEELRLYPTHIHNLSSEEAARRWYGLTMRVVYVAAVIEDFDTMQKNWEITQVDWIPKGDLSTVMPKRLCGKV